MRGRRVVAVTDGSLLSGGVLSVLREHANIDLVVIEEGRGRVYRRIQKAWPQVIIVPAERAGDGWGLSIQRLLQENPRSTVVTLSLNRPEMQMFRARQVDGATADDLLRLLEGAGKVVKSGAGVPGDGVAAQPGAPVSGRRRGR